MTPVETTLNRPLTRSELHALTDGGAQHIEALIRVDLPDLIDNDMEWLNDQANELILGETVSAGMSDFHYGVVRAEPAPDPLSWGAGSVIIHVRADVSDVLNETEDEDESND